MEKQLINEEVLDEAKGYKLVCLHESGKDEGSLDLYSDHEVTEKEIEEDMIYLKDGHFSGVILRNDFTYIHDSITEYDDREVRIDVNDIEDEEKNFSRRGREETDGNRTVWDYTIFSLKKKQDE